jgi:hypothetical protein
LKRRAVKRLVALGPVLALGVAVTLGWWRGRSDDNRHAFSL